MGLELLSHVRWSGNFFTTVTFEEDMEQGQTGQGDFWKSLFEEERMASAVVLGQEVACRT